MNCNKKDWDVSNQQFKKSCANYIQRNRVLLKYKSKALEIINEFVLNDDDFTLTQFEMKFRGQDLSKVTVLEFWEEKIEDFKKHAKFEKQQRKLKRVEAEHNFSASEKESFFETLKQQSIQSNIDLKYLKLQELLVQELKFHHL